MNDIKYNIMFYESMPFPIFREIMDFIGRVPRWRDDQYKMIQNHLSLKYCHKCGEYIDIENKHYDKYPIHLHNKYERHKKKIDVTKEYQFSYYSLREICYQLDCHLPIVCEGIKCPLIFISKQKRNYYNMVIRNHVEFFQLKNMEIIDPFYNDNFSIVYTKDLFLEEMISNFKKSDICDIIIYFMNHPLFQLQKKHIKYHELNMMYSRFYDIFIGYKKIHDFFSFADLDIIYKYNFTCHFSIAKSLLIDHYDIVLDLISEDTLNYFIKYNQKWFRRYMKQYPKIFEYITLL